MLNQSKIGLKCSVGDGAHASIKRAEQGVPYLTSKNFKHEGIDLSVLSFISEDDFYKHFKDSSKALTKPKEKDIILSIIGSIGAPYLVKEKDRFGISSSVAIIRTQEDIHPLYLFYYLKTDAVQNYVDAIKSGSAQSFLSLEMIKSIPLVYPLYSIQQYITSILLTYDKMIQVNMQRIKLLEETAHELYKEWFVRMRFPGYKQTKFVKGLPIGWEIIPINSLYKTSSGGTPSREKKEYYNNSSHNWLKTGELLDSFIFETEERISDLGLKNSSAKLFPAYTVIFAMYGNTIGQLGIITQPSATNQACCALMPKTAEFDFEFIFMTLIQHRETIISLGMGAAQQNINQEEIKKFKILKPTYELAINFKNVVNPFFKKIEILQQQNTQLRQIRDRLLPKLISGKLGLKNINQILEVKLLQAAD
jgi:type I restriction enzyme S subunit